MKVSIQPAVLLTQDAQHPSSIDIPFMQRTCMFFLSDVLRFVQLCLHAANIFLVLRPETRLGIDYFLHL